MKIKNQLTNLDVGEVSFVDKGAIGEVFTVLKCVTGDASLENELINDVKKSGITESLKTLSDADFVGMMGGMMSRYQEINKGGDNMNEENIKAIIKSAMEESMTTVNKNFVAINKSVDELQKAVTSAEAKAKAKEDAMDGGVDDAEENEDGTKKVPNKKTKACATDSEDMKKVTKSIADLTGVVSEMAKALTVISDVKKSVDALTELKLDTVITDFTKRLETVENIENTTQQAKDDIAKGAGTGEKVVFWKSILTPKSE